MTILHHFPARLAALASAVTRRQPVTPPADTRTVRPAPLAGVDVDALVARGELGYVDTASPAELAARGLFGTTTAPTIMASAARAADLAAELERRTAATTDALAGVLAVEQRAAQARAAFLADLDALGRAA